LGISPPALAMNDTTDPRLEPPETFQLTLRAVATGMLLGGGLSLCNVYTGLKVGWGLGMSITAAILSFGFWQIGRMAFGGRTFNIFEANISQTAASSGAAISSAGLVAPIPALTMITGQVLGWAPLVAWTFSVCLVGITVAFGIRRQMVEVERLPFPGGIATGETLKELYAVGTGAIARVWMLAGGAVVAAAVKVAEHLASIPRWNLPFSMPARAGGAMEKAGYSSISFGNLSLAIEPTFLMYGVGALVGIRTGLSLLFGALLAWGVIVPWAFNNGWAIPGANDPSRSWYTQGLQWILWPGVSMMVTSALTSFSFSWRSILNTFRSGGEQAVGQETDKVETAMKKWFLVALMIVLAVSVTLQVTFFDITAWIAALGVLSTFLLAIVAARVAGETNITPVGAMGKVTQLGFALLAPGSPAANLMAANVTGGAASQCADMMHDLKTGHMIGARASYQFVAQVFGAFSGAVVGSAGYLLLVPDPKNQLLTDQWPAPAVASWKAVAEIFMKGIDSLPTGAMNAMIIGGLAGIVLAVLEKVLPKGIRIWVPSPSSLGLAFVIPAYNSFSLFFGAGAAWLLSKWIPNWSIRYVVVLASGLIAGESLTGVGLAIEQVLKR
jgi:OPT family oligopeptide transporter